MDVVRLRALALATLVVLLALSACSVKPNPHASTPAPTGSDGQPLDFQDASLTGTIVHPDGSAAAGVTVTVTRLATTGEKVGDLLTAMFTGGLACLSDGGALCSATDQVVDQPTTGADGAYATTLARAYVAGFQTDADWLVSAVGPAGAGQVSGPSSSYEMEVNTPAPVAPPLTLWDQAPSVTGTRLITVAVTAPPIPADGTPTRASTEFLDTRGASVLSLTAPTVDARLLEDLALRVVGARVLDVVAHHVDGTTTYHQRLLSGGTAYQGALVPLSRGAGCAVTGPVVGPCPLTDGDLATPATAPDPAAAPTTGDATVDLGAASDIGLVVTRGCSGCAVETSTDAATWTRLAPVATAGANGLGLAAADRAVRAQYVRVLGATGLAEVSVWPPDKRAAGRGGTGVVERDSGSGPGSGSDWSKVLAGLAAALLIGAVGGVAIGRRLRRR